MEDDKKPEDNIEEVEEDTPEVVVEKVKEVSSQTSKPSKGLKIFGMTIAVLMVIISAALLYTMYSKAFYIQNNSCEVCVMEEDAICNINKQLYYKEEGKITVRSDVIPFYYKQEEETPEDNFPSEEEINEMFEGIVS